MFQNKVIMHTCKQIGRLTRLTGVRLMNTNSGLPVTETSKMEKTQIPFIDVEKLIVAKHTAAVNTVTLVGRVGADPQKRGSEQHPVIVFSLATHTNYKYEGGDYMQRTDWHRVCVFKPNLRDSVYNYLKKGQRIMVNGRLSYGEIKDEEGNARPTTAIIADDVIFFQSQQQ